MVRKRRRKKITSVKYLVDKYHIWDAREILQLLPNAEFIDITITSPPYWNLKDYGVKSQIGFGQTYDEYLDDLEKVFQDVYSITKKRGSLWIISDTIKHKGQIKLLPFDLAQRLKRIGWILQDIIIWNKDKTLPWSHQGKLRNIFEYIAFYSKERKFNYHLARVREVTELKQWWIRYPERYSPEGKAPVRTWSIPIPRQGSWGKNWVRHFNPLPPKLVERILLLTTNEGAVVLDPFCGSGAVLAQAHVMKRKYVGLDLNPSYQRMFKDQVLPAICELHKDNNGQTLKLEKSKRRFGLLIRALRKIKYPKEILRLYAHLHGSVRLEATFVLGRTNTNGLDIVFLFSDISQLPPHFLAHVKELCKRPPLSKYGLIAELSTKTLDHSPNEWLISKSVDVGKRIYLYTKGKTYAWTQRMTVGKWLKLMQNEKWKNFQRDKYPPIISNIGVKGDPLNPFSTGKEDQ